LPVRIKNPTLASSASLAVLPPLEDYISRIDWEKVHAAILGPPGTPTIPEYELEDIQGMIDTAAAKWLVRDMYDLEITGIEEEYLVPVQLSYGEQPFRGFKDICGRLRGRLNVTQILAGKKVIVDWKSTRSTLDKVWEERLIASWQWRKYLYFDDADVMLFRGFNRHGETRELMIERPAGLQEDVLVQIAGVAEQREALIRAALPVWPRRMPGACGAYGRECPHIDDCLNGTMPRAAVLPGKSFSYSSMGKFMECPERYRRGVLDEGSEDTEESLAGQSVHRGLAELYAQAKEKFQN
jgi:hypothetical protein